MVAALFHRARDLGFRFLATIPLDKSAEGFWRAAGLGSNTARFHPTRGWSRPLPRRGGRVASENWGCKGSCNKNIFLCFVAVGFLAFGFWVFGFLAFNFLRLFFRFFCF